MGVQFLYTTGYSGLDQDTFIRKIREFEIDVIVDIRGNPTSRNRDFTRSRLQPSLERSGVAYVHIQQLGVPADLRKRYKSGLALNTYLRQYRTYLRGRTETIETLGDLAARSVCCLLCLEADSDKCHRSVLADVVAKRNGNGMRVVHI